MIIDGCAIAVSSPVECATDIRSYLLACYPNVTIPPIDHIVMTATPMVAVINHGIWIAACSCGAKGMPSPGCIVFLDTPFGWCVRCGNQSWGGGWRPIDIPPEHERQIIEAILLRRPNIEDRNWEGPTESIDDLIQQNIEHGDR